MILMRREIEENTRVLQNYRDTNEDELRVVKHLMARMCHEDNLSDSKLEHWILPASNLSGDLVAAARTPDGVLHAIVADGTAHGLAAALNVLPIAPVFYAMTEKGLKIELIAAAINRTIKQQFPAGRFVAATLVSVDYATRRVRIWNGGNPPLLVFDPAGKVIKRYPPANLALGILPQAAFVPNIDEFRYAEPCQMFCCSDGVFEVLDDIGEQGGEASVVSQMQDVPPQMRLKLLRNRLLARNAEKAAHDDMAGAVDRLRASADPSWIRFPLRSSASPATFALSVFCTCG